MRILFPKIFNNLPLLSLNVVPIKEVVVLRDVGTADHVHLVTNDNGSMVRDGPREILLVLGQGRLNLLRDQLLRHQLGVQLTKAFEL